MRIAIFVLESFDGGGGGGILLDLPNSLDAFMGWNSCKSCVGDVKYLCLKILGFCEIELAELCYNCAGSTHLPPPLYPPQLKEI